jgi:hypothetical protein
MINLRAVTAAASLLLAACNTTPVEFSANESCNLPPNLWFQVPTPTEREVLLGLPEPGSANPVGKRFVASSAQREAWLKDSSGNLKACIYNPRKALSCYSRELITIDFTKAGGSWVAGPTLQGICTD